MKYQISDLEKTKGSIFRYNSEVLAEYALDATNLNSFREQLETMKEKFVSQHQMSHSDQNPLAHHMTRNRNTIQGKSLYLTFSELLSLNIHYKLFLKDSILDGPMIFPSNLLLH